MSEIKPVLHATRRHNYLEMPESVARPAGDKTWVKFGIEQNIQEFIDAGAESVQIMKHIQDAGGLENLKAAGLKDVDDVVIDRQMDIVQMNRMAKVIKIAKEKLERERAEAEKSNSSETETQGE